MSSHTLQTCNTTEMSHERLGPNAKCHSQSYSPRPHVQGPLHPPSHLIVVHHHPMECPHGTTNGIAHICMLSRLSIIHIPSLSLAIVPTQGSNIRHNQGCHGHQCYRVSRLHTKLTQKTLNALEMVSIQVDEAADGFTTRGAASWLTQTMHSLPYNIWILIPCKHKKEKEVQ